MANIPMEGISEICAEFSENSRNFNFQAAAIFLDQGIKNEKFFTPKKIFQKFLTQKKILGNFSVYFFVYSKFCNFLDLIAGIFLMLLVFFEDPNGISGISRTSGFSGTPGFSGIHPDFFSGLEIFLLFFLFLKLGAKFFWFGPRKFFAHIRTSVKLIVLLMNFFHSCVVLAHVDTGRGRIVRCLRPIFLLDSYYCYGVRR